MDKIIFWIALALTALPIVVGALLGLKRGLNRSILRLVIVVAAIVAAWLLRDTLTEAVMNLSLGGQSVKQSLEASFAENPEMLKLVMPIVKIIVGIVTFLFVFIFLKFASLIIFWLLCIAVRPGKMKNRLLGLAVGAVQGVLVAYFICVPLTGLANTVCKVSEIDFSGINGVTASAGENVSLGEVYSKNLGFTVKGVSTDAGKGDSSSEDGSDVPSEKPTGSGADSLIPDEFKPIIEAFAKYKETALFKIYSGVEFGTYKSLTTVKDDEGKNVTLDVQVEAVAAITEIAKSAQELTGIDFTLTSDMSDEEMFAKISNSLREIEKIKSKLPDEVKESITNMIAVVSETVELPVDISKVDFAKVDFAKAADAVDKCYLLQKAHDEGRVEELKAIDAIKIFVESNLVGVAADAGLDLSSKITSEADKKEFKDAIAELSESGSIDAETKADLEKIFIGPSAD